MGTSAAGTTLSTHDRSRHRRDVPVMLGIGPSQMYVDNSFPVVQEFTEGDVNSFNRKFEAVLDELRLEVQNDGWDLSGRDHYYLSELRKIGATAYQKMWPQDARDYVADLEEQEGQRGLRFTFTSRPEFTFFWEMLYAGKPFGPVDPDQFWGFRYPTGRFFIGQKYRLRKEVHLLNGLLSAIHKELKHSLAEVEAIQELLRGLPHIVGQDILLDVLDKILPEAENDPTKLLEMLIERFHAEDFPYGIIHFACHAENPGEAPAIESTLGLSIRKEELWISLQDIISYGEFGFQRSPFVFLNACSSATIGHLLESSTFPAGFLSFGAASVIATACTMPDNFASAFAREFYSRLFDPNRPTPIFIGDILWETRLHFLQKYNNPLGLAYGLYAVSEQQFRSPAGE